MALATDAAELSAHLAVRRQIFVTAQGLFLTDDRDAHDDAAATLHVVGRLGGRVCGAVRLYPLDADGRWKGDRLAVLPSERARRLGALLVRFAVATAAARGGHTMDASIQAPNIGFFERLGWRCTGARGVLHGLEHHAMSIALDVSQRQDALSERRAR